jgi:DNA-binding beta-propeller fold protein YncE
VVLHDGALMPRLPVLCALLLACPSPEVPSPEDTDPIVADPTVEAGADLIVQVGEAASFLGISNSTDAVWDLGDGTVLDGLDVSHTYSTPGNRIAVLQVTDDRGRRATDVLRVTVHLPLADPPLRASSPLLVHAGAAWVVTPEAGTLTRVDLLTQATDVIEVCDGPRTVTPFVDLLAIACEDEDAIAFVDPLTRVSTLLDLGPGRRPYGVLAADGSVFVTAQGTGELLEVSTTTVLERISIGPDPRALAIDDAGEAWVSRLRAAQDRGEIYGPHGAVVLAKDPGPDSDTANRGVPTNLHAVAISPDGGRLYIGGTVSNVDAGQWIEGDDSLLGFDTTLRATLRVLDLTTGAEDFNARRQYDNHGQITALAVSPLGNRLWLAHQGTHTLTRLDAYTLSATGAILNAGQGIDALAVADDGRTLLVHAWLDRELRAYDVSDPSLPSPPLLWTAPTLIVEPLSADILLGKQLFHDSADTRLSKHGYQTCNACHPDGRDDGITWDFTQRGEGMRNTISLEGHGGTAMGRVHWTGNFDEIQDFENDIRGGQGGTGLLSPTDWDESAAPLGASKAGRSDELDALAAYVSSLSHTPASPFDAPEGGAALFDAAGCAECHPPGHSYTDSNLLAPLRHDVGTLSIASGQRLGAALDGLDTPTLLGTFATGPYLHDGSAQTLSDAIVAHVPDLSPAEVQLLAEHVRSLPEVIHDVTE